MKINARWILIIVSAVFIVNVLHSQELNRKITDPKLNEEILYGYCNRAGLEEGEFGKYFKEYYSIYQPDKNIVKQLKRKTNGVRILIVMGSWCSDSQEQVPKFFKILDKTGYDGTGMTIICVDKDKLAGDIDVHKYDIQKVPTFIMFRGESEVGRIIETPVATLEKDLLLFLGN